MVVQSHIHMLNKISHGDHYYFDILYIELALIFFPDVYHTNHRIEHQHYSNENISNISALYLRFLIRSGRKLRLVLAMKINDENSRKRYKEEFLRVLVLGVDYFHKYNIFVNAMDWLIYIEDIKFSAEKANKLHFHQSEMFIPET